MTWQQILFVAFLGYLIGRWREHEKHRFDHCPKCGGHTEVERGYDYRYDDKLICKDCGHVVATRWSM